MADSSTRESLSLPDLQRQTLVKRKSSVKVDAKEFTERQSELNKREWVDSRRAASCSKCAKRFGLTKRKHHCRECGKVFCSKCSAFQIVISGVLKRACQDCYEESLYRDGKGGKEEDSDIPANSAMDLSAGTPLTNTHTPGDDLPPWIEGLVYV
eukprot:gene32868-39747_t